MRLRQGGFTLLEILVGVAVLGLIIGVLYGGVSFALQAAQRQDAVLAKTGDYDAVNRALRRLIAEADPGGPGIVPLRGTPGRMTFSSRMPDGAGGGAADMALGITGGTVVLRWTPRRPGRPLGPAPAAREAELLRGAQRVELSYWGASGWRSEWVEAMLPALVRLRVIFAPGDARHWPDMVLATRQQTAS
ncbi:MAG: PulJ/GspJ family protein [Janthinobacterium lividum]